MARPESVRRLIVNADDFGRSHSINEAVIQAHQRGILTTASLMVNGDAADEAVEMARACPRLGVGLHLTLVCGTSALPPMAIPDLVNSDGRFSDDAVGAGFRYFAKRSLRPQLAAEINAQFEKFQRAGLPLDHVNGHLNLHLHPAIFGLLMNEAERWGIRHIRLTRDPFRLNVRLSSGQWFYRISHAIIFCILSGHARPVLRRKKIRHTNAVFGLLQNGRVHEGFVEKLLLSLPPGDSELYSHPSLDEFKAEYDALISPRVRERAGRLGIRLIRYQDL